ncbi:MAG: galactose ABC transporter substrate-binding protein [Oscillospiraceae bacterium]|nr:galactose ABC transporter substrate-binding protein [Oscillospiraceae bacterium]
MKKKMIVLLNVFAVCFLLAAFSGCRQNSLRIAFFIYNGNDTFITETMRYMTAHVPPDMAFEVRDAGNSQAVQNQQIAGLLDDGVDLFVINAVDRLACGSIVEKCAKSGIPVIFFNREPLEGALIGDDVFYVGAAADSLGKKQADMVAELFAGFDGSGYDKNGDGEVQLVILKGEQGHQDAEKRTENCVARLRDLGFQVDVLAIEVADWNRSDAYEAMKRLYAQYGDSIELVFSNNDDMALGAIDYLKDAGVFSDGGEEEYSQPFVIVGVDGTEVGLEAIKNGLLYGTVNNDSENQADAILALTDYILTGKDFEGFPYEIANDHYIFIDGDIITRSSLGDYAK